MEYTGTYKFCIKIYVKNYKHGDRFMQYNGEKRRKFLILYLSNLM